MTNIYQRNKTSHGLHLVLTFCTCGLWAVTGWPLAWAWNRFGPRNKTVIRGEQQWPQQPQWRP